ncbi:uncharacterized protein ACRADG_006637 [Cochliomyia hominivorax]
MLNLKFVIFALIIYLNLSRYLEAKNSNYDWFSGFIQNSGVTYLNAKNTVKKITNSLEEGYENVKASLNNITTEDHHRTIAFKKKLKRRNFSNHIWKNSNYALSENIN